MRHSWNGEREGTTLKKTLAGLVAAALVTAPLMSASEAQGLTDWKTFGSATTRGIGDWSDLEGVHDLVWVGAQSTTRAFPQRLRIVVTGPSQGKAEIRWSLGCWNSDSQFRVIRGFVTTGRLPRTIDL